SQGNLADTAGTNARFAGYEKRLTEYVFHASFLKLRELTARFDLPKSFVSGVGRGVLNHASLVLTGRNLLTWTNYPGLHPEVSNCGPQQFGRGQAVTPFPPTRSYFMALELGF